MKKRTISKIKSLFGSKKAKRQLQQQQSSKSSRSPSPPPELEPEASINDTFRPLPRTPPPTRAGPPPSPPVPTHPVAPVAPEPSAPLPLLPCQVCGRTFVPESLAKHVKICEKMTVKKRKTFDSSRQRREGTDLEQYLPKNFGLPENSPFLEKSPPNTAKVTPKPKSQSVRSAITKPMAELQKCPYCGRAFGPRAFERHVEWCADKAKILPAAPTAPPPHLADAKLRLHARTQYKAPPVRTRRSSQSRDKASNSRSASVDSSRGVSPPREYGDYKPGRTRASESLSSNDCQDDLSPHIPVIRNSRNTQNNSSGDANVKARQARLARDISNSRKPQESHPHSSVQQSKTDSNINKKNLECRNKLKNKLSVKRQQQLKKLEEIANKFNERTMNKRDNIKTTDKKIVKSQIPIPTKIIRNEPISETNKQTNDKSILEQCTKESKPANDIKGKSFKQVLEESISKVNTKNIKTATVKLKEKFNTTKKPIKLAKEWSISLDSLEECQLSNNEKKCHSIGINTELLCPCIPCVIYENPEQNKSNKRKQNNETNALIKINNNVQEPKIELLYKNLAVGSSSDLQIKVDSEEKLNFQNSQSLLESPSITENKIYHTHLLYTESNMTDQIIGATSRYSETLRKVDNGNINSNENNARKIRDFSTEHFENNYEQDNSSCEMLDDSIENKFTNYNDNENNIGRHGSSDTYTKFTENPHDLEEFINITDTMITNQTIEQKHAMEMDVETLITPKTNSIEAIDTIVLDVSLKQGKCNFCDTLEELKDNLNKLLDDSNNNELLQLDQNSIKEVNEKRKVCDMEHITVYELKFQEQKQIEKANILIDGSAAFKLPAIFENNKPERKLTCNKKRMQKIYKPKRKYIMLGNQSRNNTFIVNNHEDSDNLSVTSEAPPLKLPRIELKRLDDNYDPFASAAKQMKELMSSDTNIPQKLKNSSKDPNRTLPILRPTKEKAHSYLRITDNTKMMKDTLNKTYQKTPTLQRMKSFGSSNNDNTNSTIGSRCSSFRLNRNDKKPSPKLNTTFTKSSKENVGTTDKMYFNRNNSLNRSFSSYTTSNYSTPKPKDKIPKIATSMYHSFQRNTIKQPVKLDKIKRPEEKTDFVNLDIILTDDNSSMTDSNYIDPRLINENDNLPINVNTILNNPDIISSMESLLTTENLPAKFESFNTSHQNNNACNDVVQSKFKFRTENNNIKSTAPTIDDLSAQYDKIMTSLEQSIASKTSIRDDDSLCEDFDLEEFMTSFDEEINRQKVEKRTCSSTTRVVKQSELVDSNRTSEFNSISPSLKVVKSSSNGMIPVNKSISLNFSSNNIVSESLFPSSVKRSTSLLDSIQKNTAKADSAKNRNKVDQLEQDIMQSLKDLNKFYEPERNDNNQTHKESANYKTPVHNGTTKRDTRVKSEKKIKKNENVTNENYTPNGKTSNDSAYSSLNRISPSKLSLCNSKESNGVTSLEQIPAGSDSSGSHKEDVRSVSSEEFLAMERSAEIDEPHSQLDMHTSYKELDCNAANEKRSSSRTSWNHGRSGSGGGGGQLSSSGSEASLQRREVVAPRFSRFCHECGSKFPVDTAKFCIECGVRRLLV